MSERKQYNVVNGELSDQAYVTSGVIKLRVGTNSFRPVHVYADDTTIYCIGESVDSVSKMLNNALKELEDWSSTNHLVPHPKKCEAMMLLRGSFTGLLNAVQPHNKIGDPRTIVSGLLGVTIDNKLAWSQHIFEVKKSFVNKLNLLKRSSFLPRNILVDLYFEIILPSYIIVYFCLLSNRTLRPPVVEQPQARSQRYDFNFYYAIRLGWTNGN